MSLVLLPVTIKAKCVSSCTPTNLETDILRDKQNRTERSQWFQRFSAQSTDARTDQHKSSLRPQSVTYDLLDNCLLG